MPALDDHITNLESDALIQKWLENARKAKEMAATEQEHKEADYAFHLASQRHAGHIDTHGYLKMEHGEYIVGKPRGTKYKSAKKLEAEGFVGIYKAKHHA